MQRWPADTISTLPSCIKLLFLMTLSLMQCSAVPLVTPLPPGMKMVSPYGHLLSILVILFIQMLKAIIPLLLPQFSHCLSKYASILPNPMPASTNTPATMPRSPAGQVESASTPVTAFTHAGLSLLAEEGEGGKHLCQSKTSCKIEINLQLQHKLLT